MRSSVPYWIKMQASFRTKVLLAVAIKLFILFLLCSEAKSEDLHAKTVNKGKLENNKNNTKNNIKKNVSPSSKQINESHIFLCNEGHEWSYELKTCRPSCNPKCGGNQDCVAPETCACSFGYIWNNNTQKCVPQCIPSCPMNSFCKQSGFCDCNKGFNREMTNNKLSCVVPIVWWIYLLIAVLVLVILASVGGIIYYFASRSQRINYYPNKNFANITNNDCTDTTTIIS